MRLTGNILFCLTHFQQILEGIAVGETWQIFSCRKFPAWKEITVIHFLTSSFPSSNEPY